MSTVRDWSPAAFRWLPAAAAVVVGAACGVIAFLQPDLLTLNLHWSPAVAAAAVAGFGILLLTFRRPLAGACILLALTWSNLSEILVRLHGLPSALQLLVPAVLFALLLRRVALPGASTGGARRGASPGALFALAAFLYLAVVVASTTWAFERETAAAAATELVKAAILALVLAHAFDDARQWRLALWTLVLTAALLSALSSFQALTASWSLTFGGLARVKQAFIAGTVFQPRATGPLADPNFYAQVLLCLAPVAVGLALASRARLVRVLALLAASLLALGVVTTYSRGGALALGVALAVLAARERRRLRPQHLAWGALFGLVLLVAAPGLFVSRLGTLSVLLPTQSEGLQAQDSSVNKRKVLMGAAAAMAIDHPVMGLGIGNFGDHFDEYADRVGAAARIYQDPGERAYPHSLYLEILAETGLLGLAGFAAVAACALGLAASAARRFAAAGDEGSALLANALLAGMVAYFASSLILHGDYIRYLWVLFGLAVAAARVAPASGAGADR